MDIHLSLIVERLIELGVAELECSYDHNGIGGTVSGLQLLSIMEASLLKYLVFWGLNHSTVVVLAPGIILIGRSGPIEPCECF